MALPQWKRILKGGLSLGAFLVTGGLTAAASLLGHLAKMQPVDIALLAIAVACFSLAGGGGAPGVATASTRPTCSHSHCAR